MVRKGILAAMVGMAICIGSLQGAGISAGNVPTAIAAPAWELKDVSGKTVRSTDFAGRVVVVDFWATWCGPCRMEVPALMELQKRYAGQGVVVVGVSVDELGVEAVKQFVQRDGINYPVVLADERILAAFGRIEVIPTIFVIDRRGYIDKRYLGFTDERELEAEIQSLLRR